MIASGSTILIKGLFMKDQNLWFKQEIELEDQDCNILSIQFSDKGNLFILVEAKTEFQFFEIKVARQFFVKDEESFKNDQIIHKNLTSALSSKLNKKTKKKKKQKKNQTICKKVCTVNKSEFAGKNGLSEGIQFWEIYEGRQGDNAQRHVLTSGDRLFIMAVARQ